MTNQRRISPSFWIVIAALLASAAKLYCAATTEGGRVRQQGQPVDNWQLAIVKQLSLP